jgi:hypothetical protein
MLKRAVCRDRVGERGQTLILALAFIAFFGLVVVAVLRFADATGLQHVHTEATASSDSSAEGGAAYAAAIAASTTPACPSTGNTLTMQSGDTVGYTVNDCNSNTSTLGGPGGHCLLCILNETAASNVLTIAIAQCKGNSFCGLKTIGGDDYINGGITGSLTACSNPPLSCPGNAHIRVILPASNYAGCVCNPSPTTYPQKARDPLASLLAPTSVGEPSNCVTPQSGETWNAATGCSVSLQGTGKNPVSYTLNPGVWNTISISGKADVVLTPGVYVLTGSLSDSGQGDFCAPGTITGGVCNLTPGNPTPGVTLYLTCPGSATSGQAYLPCPASGSSTGGTLSFSGQAQATMQAPGCPDGDVIPCPSLAYGHVAVLADQNLLDPGLGCASGSNCIFSVAGTGDTINGSVDTRSGGISISGNGGDSVSDGFLIVNSLYMTVSGQATSGLNLSGPGSLTTTATCFVYDDSVYSGITAPPNPARAVIQAQCGTQSSSGVVDFNYGP